MRWEYLEKNDLSASDLNQLGANGWELVSVVYHPLHYIMLYYFKRPL